MLVARIYSSYPAHTNLMLPLCQLEQGRMAHLLLYGVRLNLLQLQHASLASAVVPEPSPIPNPFAHDILYYYLHVCCLY